MSPIFFSSPFKFPTLFQLFCILDRRKLSTGTDTVLSRTSHKSQKTPKANISRKLEIEFNKAFFGERRRNKSNDKDISSSSSAASSDAENDSHIDIVLNQSRRDLENTQALKIRRHLLHSEDYVSTAGSANFHSLANRIPEFKPIISLQTEIIATCSDNLRCLKTVLLSPSGSLLSSRRYDLIRGELIIIPDCSSDDILHFVEFIGDSVVEFAEFVISNWPLSKLLVEILKKIRTYRILPISL